MTDATLAHVRRTCAEGRYFPYDDWRDRLFVPPSIFLVWVFVRLGWSGNAVSWLSGAVAAAGGVLLASDDPRLVALGSFGYMAFYFLDYVDGGVARYRGQSSVSGQYVDWIMHVIAAVAVASGLFAGALTATGAWIIPFGVLTVVASALALDRFALAWFSICMRHQQQQVNGSPVPPEGGGTAGRRSPLHRAVKIVSLATFHENYAIFVLPALALGQLFSPYPLPDFRVVLVVIGGAVCFPFMVWEIQLMASERRIETHYRKLFFSHEPPRLPDDHFLLK